MPLTIKVGLSKVRNQAKPLNILEKMLYFLPTYSRCSNVWPPTSIHNRKWSTRDCRVRSKMPGCCCLNETGNNVFLKINWRWVNQGFHAAFLRGISTATTTLSEPMQTLMLHLFTPPSKTLCGQLLVGHCAQLYNQVFIVNPRLSAQIYGVFLEEILQNCRRKSL